MTTHRVPDTPLPAPGQSDEAAHAAISQRFREHTTIEIEKGNRLQASEKIWASVAHQLKAVAEDRGWANEAHPLLRDIARQLSYETRNRRVRDLFRVIESTHRNFYENDIGWDEIEDAREDAEALIALLQDIRARPPGRYRITNESDQARVARLMGVELHTLNPEQRATVLARYPIGTVSDVGFSRKYGYRPPEQDGGNDGGTPVPRGPSGGSPAPGAPALGQITQVGSAESSPATGTSERTRRGSRRSGRASSQAPAKPRKSHGSHAYLRKGEGKGRY